MILSLFLFAQSVGVTIAPQQGLVNRIYPLKISLLVKENLSPESWHPTLPDIQQFLKVDIYFALGNSFEERLIKKLQLNNVVLPANIRWREEDHIDHTDHLIEHISDYKNKHHSPNRKNQQHQEKDHHHRDPHIWLSFHNLQMMGESIYQRLQRERIDHKLLEKNYRQFLADLQKIERRGKKELASFSSNYILVYHPAYGYFLDQFALKQLPIEDHGRTPSLKYLHHLAELVKKNNIKYILCRTEAEEVVAAKVAKSLGVKTIVANPLLSDPLQIYDHLINLLVKILHERTK